METSKPNKDILPPSWHGQKLARREAQYQAGKIPVYDWSDAKARLDARRDAL